MDVPFFKNAMTDYHQLLLPEQTYHLFSRAVGKEKLFLSEENYFFFLKKLKHHTASVCDFYCYSLLPNHFHLLGKICDEEKIIRHFEEVKNTAFDLQQHSLPDFVMERFSNCLNSYTKAFNNLHNRKGALFKDYLKRSKCENDQDFTTYVWYVHKNAVHHQLTDKIGAWKFDSYQSILSDERTSLLRKEVIEWFGNKEAFINFHQQPVFPKIDIIDT